VIVIEREAYSESLKPEILPLAQKCWDEASAAKGEHCAFNGKRDVKIEPDFALYQAISDNDRLVLFTIRDDAKLVGYAIALVYPSPHHCKLITANGDSIYVEPPYRVHSPVLVEKIINEVSKTGAVTMNWGVTKDEPMYRLLSKFGFVADEVIMEKLLCVS
jgi:GNAT superfamily N-acetyltransferase